MKFSKFLMMVLTATATALIYIQLQTQIVDLAYKGRNTEKIAQGLADENGYMKYIILELKSANHLGVKLLSDNSKMKFLDGQHIVKMEIPQTANSRYIASLDTSKKKPNIFNNIFSLKSQAEAGLVK